MLADWAIWFDPTKPWWLEKSPVNLTRMRLYQQLFPMSQFVVILRHPQVLARALQKWVDRPEAELIDYALATYEQVMEDSAFLHAVTVLRYEDLVTDPESAIAGLGAFLELPPHPPQIDIRDGNADYPLIENLKERIAQRMVRWGYGGGGQVLPYAPFLAHPLRSVRENTTAHLLAMRMPTEFSKKNIKS